ncbi:hypothetical protein [Burkholderia pseudomallei]
MTKRKDTPYTAAAWGDDVQSVISRLDRLRSTIMENGDLASMNMRAEHRELEAISNAIAKIRAGLSTLKRGATDSSKRRKLSPSRPGADATEGFGRRLTGSFGRE